MSEKETCMDARRNRNLSQYDRKYVQIRDAYGDSFTGIARYEQEEFLAHEYGGSEDGIFIEDVLLYRSQIASIEETERHGTAELWTRRLVLRRYREEDAEDLYRELGRDPSSAEYSGWNPYATLELARKTVQQFLKSYQDEHFYGWLMEEEEAFLGTIGAYDYRDGKIEVGFTVKKSCRGRGYATEALTAVLRYLTENEGIACVTAWCAAENTGSKSVLEKAGMQLVRTEKGGLAVGDTVYDRLIYEYRAEGSTL